MGTPADIIPAKTAAKMLGIDGSAIHHLVRQGALLPATPPAGTRKQSRQRFFRLHDIAALAEARSRQGGLPETLLIARQAIALSTSNARRLDELCHILGVDGRALEVTEEAVVALYLAVEELKLLEEREAVRGNASKILDWARTLYAVDEAYLALVCRFTNNDEPWDPYLSLAQRLSEEAPRQLFTSSKELEHAYGYLEAARRHMRHVAFFYTRAKNMRTAGRVFDRGEDYTSPIINLLFPH